MADFLRYLFSLKDPTTTSETSEGKSSELERSQQQHIPPAMLAWSQDPSSVIMITKSDLVYYVIIAVLSIGMVILFVEYRR